MSTLERAIQIAVEAHSGQVDKAGMERLVRECHGSCLFVLDSGYASALA